MVACVSTASLAYFTDNKTVDNVFTAGEVTITLDEAEVTLDGANHAQVDTSVRVSVATQDYGKLYPGKTCHAIGHEFSAVYDVTHGEILSILTPRWMRFILRKDPSVAPRFARFARNVWNLSGENEYQLAEESINCLEDFLGSIGIAINLTSLGIGSTDFDDIATHADLRGRCSNSYVPLTHEDVVQILNDCL